MPNQPTPTYRLLDAAANRAGEAARVVEDYVRFVLDDAYLTEQCKQFRHDLADAVRAIDFEARHASRDTTGDVGCDVTTEAETQRDDAAEVCTASFKRLQQSLRSLEEFGKTLDAEMAGWFEQLRYEAYTLEKAVTTTNDSRRGLEDVRLCVLVDGRASIEEFVALISQLVDADVDMIQLRDKQLDDRTLLVRAQAARILTRGSETRLIFNDRADLAVAAQADGVHVGQEDMNVRDALAVVGPQSLVGVSTHSFEQARQAVLDGANYIGVGPVFASTTKSFSELQGTDLLAAVDREITLPAFAIGGINRTNIDRVVEAGIRRVAVSQAVIGADDPGAEAKYLKSVLCGEQVDA